MTNFVKLTNNNDTNKGEPIYINPDHITAVHEFNPGGGFVTSLFSVFGQQWIVEESPAEVAKLFSQEKV